MWAIRSERNCVRGVKENGVVALFPLFLFFKKGVIGLRPHFPLPHFPNAARISLRCLRSFRAVFSSRKPKSKRSSISVPSRNARNGGISCVFKLATHFSGGGRRLG